MGVRYDASARRRGRRLAEPLGPAASGEENVERLAQQQQVEMPVGVAVPTETRVIHRQRCEATPSRTWRCACTGVAGLAAERARANGMEEESR